MSQFIRVKIKGTSDCLIMVQSIRKIETGNFIKGCLIYLNEDDVDNRIKQLLDSIYKPLKANDALIIFIQAQKKADDEGYTIVNFTPFTPPQKIEITGNVLV
jgi:Holliday junction resolvase RusA-like endonuclease